MWPGSLLLIYCVFVAAASLIGGLLPTLFRISHTRMQVLISLIGGVMLGVALFHQIPHATASLAQHGAADPVTITMNWVMAGLITLFIMLRAFHFHHHGAAEIPDEHGPHGHAQHHHPHHSHGQPPGNSPQPESLLPIHQPALTAHSDHDCGHDHDHDQGPAQSVVYHPALHDQTAHQFSWVALTMGLVLHTFIDGMALAAAVRSEAQHAPGLLLGLGTFLAIAMHKPLDSLSIASLMLAGGWTRDWRNSVNFSYAAMCPLGALLFHFGVMQFTAQQHLIVGCALAFSAGAFMCIALSDLLPEVEFHSHDRIQLTAALLMGVLLAWAIGLLEPAGLHANHAHGAVSVPASP